MLDHLLIVGYEPRAVWADLRRRASRLLPWQFPGRKPDGRSRDVDRPRLESGR